MLPQIAPIGPNMPLSHEILHNRMFQHPGRPSLPVNMDRVIDYLLSCKKAQNVQFNKAHGAHVLPKLTPDQEVIFSSPVNSKYIPRTTINKDTMPPSYYVEAQGKRYCRTRGHSLPIHLNLPPAQQQQPTPTTPA